MIIAYPHLLWLLVLAPLLAYVGFRVRSGGRWRGWVLGLRLLCTCAIVFALSRPLLQRRANNAVSVLVIDIGPTMPPKTIAQAGREAGKDFHIIAFSNRATVLNDSSLLTKPELLAALRGRLALPIWSDDSPTGGSNLAAALQLAGAQIPPGAAGDITVCTNGLTTKGDATAQAYRLAERGIALDIKPAGVEQIDPTPVVLRSVLTDAAAAVGQTIKTTVQLESQSDGMIQLSVMAGDQKPVVTSQKVNAGLNQIDVYLPLEKQGLIPLMVSKSSSQSVPLGAVWVSDAPRVLFVGGDLEPAALQQLQSLLGKSARVESISPAQLANTPLEDIGSVVLSDVPADQISVETQKKLQTAVADGTGLLLTGAARSFGGGGYNDSQLASLLPVEMPQQIEKINPDTTLVLIIDTSGSMAGEKLVLAKEIARLAISHLQARDKVGIVEFFAGKRWAAPIQSAGNISIIHRALNRLTAGGSTALYPALEEASFALRSIHTRGKQVMILSDGGIEDSPFQTLASEMAGEGVIVSAVELMPDPGPSFMPDIARLGRGHYYCITDRYSLPDITLKKPKMSMLSPMRFTVSPVELGDDALLHNISAGDLAPIDAYVKTRAKPTADVLLKTTSGDPLMVRWRYGNGFVAAIPTQLGSTMTQEIQNKPGFATLISQLFRQMNGPSSDKLQLNVIQRPAGVEVEINLSGVVTSATTTRPTTSSGVFQATPPVDGMLNLSLLDDTGKVIQNQTATAISAGHWNVLLQGVTSGIYQLIARDYHGQLQGHGGFAVPPTTIQPAFVADSKLLDELNGFTPLARDRAAAMRRIPTEIIELQKPLSIIAVLLLLLTVAVRRWPAEGFFASRQGA